MTETEIVERFRQTCEESINPDLYSVLVDEIIPALKLARKDLRVPMQKYPTYWTGSAAYIVMEEYDPVT